MRSKAVFFKKRGAMRTFILLSPEAALCAAGGVFRRTTEILPHVDLTYFIVDFCKVVQRALTRSHPTYIKSSCIATTFGLSGEFKLLSLSEAGTVETHEAATVEEDRMIEMIPTTRVHDTLESDVDGNGGDNMLLAGPPVSWIIRSACL